MRDGDDHTEGPGIGCWLGGVLILWILIFAGTMVYLGVR